MKKNILYNRGKLLVPSLVAGIGFWKFMKGRNEATPEYIVQFIKNNISSNDVSLFINHNDETLVEVNPNVKLPLASTVKIIIAIEYAQQAAEGIIDPKQEVKLADLAKLYIPKTDGGAHEAWLSQLGKDSDIVPLREVVDGMIAYSSNANTDYLMNLLGLDHINSVPKSLGITNHDPLYPIYSSLFIPSTLMKEKNLTKKETLQAMINMDVAEYRGWALAINEKWKNKAPTEQEKKEAMKIMSLDFQRVWSDRLSRSTTKNYVSIMKILNNKIDLDQNVHKHLDPVMEQLMKNPNNRKWLLHAGQKGGSTAFVLTKAMYATDKDGNRTELAIFTDNLSPSNQEKLARSLNDFQLQVLTNPKFRQFIKEEVALSSNQSSK
ncbi:serine hydrolase [Peribacillus sp. NPDC097675]|uniref:serine hydrolase n=1 Tax=Peribacillus sp. NPDC097675 TaxID=3390618 RepID=UPI003CFE4F69